MPAPSRSRATAFSAVATTKLVHRHPPVSWRPRQVRLWLCGFVTAARALTACSGFCGVGQAVLAAAAAPMAGLAGRHGDDFDRKGKQAGPVEALGRADTAAGRRRGGKPPERPPAAGPPSQADAAAVRRVLEVRRWLSMRPKTRTTAAAGTNRPAW